jgi:hypothetical protein
MTSLPCSLVLSLPDPYYFPPPPYLSPVGSLGCVEEQVASGGSFCPIGKTRRADLFAFPSCFLYNPKFRQAHCSACHLLDAGFLVDLFFDLEDGGDIQQPTQCVPEDRRLHNHHCESLKSYKLSSFSFILHSQVKY